ncbi:NUDIX domain-containing protein [bacterium]|nr:NUDIX domain-containing protein [bacterium]
MSKDPIPSWFFVVVAVRHEGRFLLIQERKHGQAWYFPAGRVEPGESYVEAAQRETFEESGVKVRITGLLRIEHSQPQRGNRIRFLFTAEPAGDPTPKAWADKESLGARWFTLDQVRSLFLRGDDVVEVFEYLERGGPVAPLSILAPEGSEIV